jgi:hypothetical protein
MFVQVIKNRLSVAFKTHFSSRSSNIHENSQKVASIGKPLQACNGTVHPVLSRSGSSTPNVLEELIIRQWRLVTCLVRYPANVYNPQYFCKNIREFILESVFRVLRCKCFHQVVNFLARPYAFGKGDEFDRNLTIRQVFRFEKIRRLLWCNLQRACFPFAICEHI